MQLKEMAKKTRTVTSEEDDAPDSGERCIRVGINYHTIQILEGEIFGQININITNSQQMQILPDKLSNQAA